MRCSNCKSDVDDTLETCPVCGKLFHDNEDEIILPQLNSEKQNPKTNISKSEDPNLDVRDFDIPILYQTNEYLIDHPPKETDTKEFSISEVNQNNLDPFTNTKQVASLASLTQNQSLSDNQNISVAPQPEPIANEDKKTKKKYLLTTTIIALCVIAGFFIVSSFFRQQEPSPSPTSVYNYMTEIDNALTEYYNSQGENYESLIDVLKHVSNDSHKVSEVKAETLSTIDKWLDQYLNQEITNTSEFSKLTDYYKKLLNTLYNKVEYQNIKLLESTKYNEYNNEIDEIYLDSKDYFSALDYYNDKSYNESYEMLNNVNKESRYYSKTLEQKKKIEDTIISYIKSDITKIEGRLSSATESQKNKIYMQIEDVITRYEKIYYNIPLNENEEYISLLNKYNQLKNSPSADNQEITYNN